MRKKRFLLTKNSDTFLFIQKTADFFYYLLHLPVSSYYLFLFFFVVSFVWFLFYFFNEKKNSELWWYWCSLFSRLSAILALSSHKTSKIHTFITFKFFFSFIKKNNLLNGWVLFCCFEMFLILYCCKYNKYIYFINIIYRCLLIGEKKIVILKGRLEKWKEIEEKEEEGSWILRNSLTFLSLYNIVICIKGFFIIRDFSAWLMRERRRRV